MNRIEKLKNDIYTFEELDTMEKNATQLDDRETLGLIEHSRMSKTVRGDKRVVVEEKTQRTQKQDTPPRVMHAKETPTKRTPNRNTSTRNTSTRNTKKPDAVRKDRRKGKRSDKPS